MFDKKSSLKEMVFSALEEAAIYIQNNISFKDKINETLKETTDVQEFKDLLNEKIKGENITVQNDLKIYLNYLDKVSVEKS